LATPDAQVAQVRKFLGQLKKKKKK